MVSENILNRIPAFRDIDKKTIELLSDLSELVSWNKGQILFRAREPVNAVYFVVSGKAMIYNLVHSGKRKVIFILGEGQMLNDHIISDHETSVYAETLEKSDILMIPRDSFILAMKNDFGLTENVMEAQERKIWRLGHQLKNTMGSIYMERKLAAKLWKLGRDFGIPSERGTEIDLSLSVTFLADMLGTPRETASRLCNTLIENGLICMDKKRITILDQDGLADFYKKGIRHS